MPHPQTAGLGDDDTLVRAGQDVEDHPRYVVGLTAAEMQELIWLIDDDPVDEQILTRIRRRVSKKLNRIDRGELSPPTTNPNTNHNAQEAQAS